MKTNIKAVRMQIRELHEILGSWRACEEELGIAAGTLCAYAKERAINNPKHRIILGLSSPRKARKAKDLFGYTIKELASMIKNRKDYSIE